MTFVGGGTPAKVHPEYWKGDIVWLSSQEVKGGYISSGTYKITEEAVANSATRLVDAYTPLIVSRSGILAHSFPVTLPTKPVAINQDIKALLFDRSHIASDFIVATLQESEYEILTSVVKTGTTVQSVNLPDLKRLAIGIPSLEEQNRVSALFKTLNSLIAAHERKLDLLKKKKTYYLQQIFSQKLRFEGFTEPWQQRKLGEYFSERRETSAVGKMLSVTINNGVVPATELDRKDNSSEDKSHYKCVHIDDLPYNSMRMWQGASGVSLYNGIVSPAYTVLCPKPGSVSAFFAIAFKQSKMLQIFQRFSQGLTSDTWNLKYPQLSLIEMSIPLSDEQQLISTIAKTFDALIASHEYKLELLKRKKQAYLQKMFV